MVYTGLLMTSCLRPAVGWAAVTVVFAGVMVHVFGWTAVRLLSPHSIPDSNACLADIAAVVSWAVLEPMEMCLH